MTLPTPDGPTPRLSLAIRFAGGAGDPAEIAAEPVVADAPLPVAEAAPPLPERGRIVYRVDRGDSNFEIGRARHEWEIADDLYHLRSVVETTGLVWLFRRIASRWRAWER